MGTELIPARAASTFPSPALVKHFVVWDPYLVRPSAHALCGHLPRFGWVMRPSWPKRICPKCQHAAEFPGHVDSRSRHPLQ